MSKKSIQDLKDVAETLLVPLYYRAVESQRPDALVKDERAQELMAQIDYDFSRFKRQSFDQVATLMRLREFDRCCQAFLTEHPQGVVVHIGCGLDTRFDRVDNGMVEWYDLDLPEVITLRKRFIEEGSRCHFLACSVLDKSWMDIVGLHAGRSFLFMAEGVFPYFSEAQVKGLVLTLAERSPGAELVCDAMSPFFVRVHNLELASTKIAARLHWGLKRGKDLEARGAGIRLLGEWFYFDEPEPRLGRARLLRYVPLMGKGVGIFRYRLGGRSSGSGTEHGSYDCRGQVGEHHQAHDETPGRGLIAGPGDELALDDLPDQDGLDDGHRDLAEDKRRNANCLGGGH